RNLPTPPTVQNQTATQPGTPPVAPVDLTHWAYSFDYLYRFAAQDTVNTSIHLNLAMPESGLAALVAGPDLFTALAQFVTSYPAIAADFTTYFGKIDAKTTDKTITGAASKATAAFAQSLRAGATAYAGTVGPRAAAVTVPTERIELDFATALTQDAM